jgi:GDP-L-fucose synthase
MHKSSKIYLAGHSGMVGSSIHRLLKSEGFSNIIYRKSSELDLKNQSQVNDFFDREKPEYVFLAAAKVGGIIANSTRQADFIYDNLAIAQNVIHASYKFGVKRLLNLGSSCIYPKLASQPMNENQLLTGLLEPTNEAYAIAKIAAIKLCRYFNEQYGTEFFSIMPTNLYGSGDNYNLEKSHVLPALIRKIILGKALQEKNFELIRTDLSQNPIGWGFDGNIDYEDKQSLIEILDKTGIRENSVYIWGSGSPLREFLHVDDLGVACLHFMQRDNISEWGEFLNIGSGSEISIKDLAILIKEIVGYGGKLDFDHTKPDGTPRKLMDSTRANSLGWSAKIDLRGGVGSVVDDYLGKLR